MGKKALMGNCVQVMERKGHRGLGGAGGRRARAIGMAVTVDMAHKEKGRSLAAFLGYSPLFLVWHIWVGFLSRILGVKCCGINRRTFVRG